VLPESIEVYTNFFEVQTPQNWKLNQYHVDFDPQIESRRIRIGLLLTTHAALFPTNRAFDGQTLYTTTDLPEYLELVSQNEKEKQNIKITIRKTSEILPATKEFVRLFNIVFKRCLTLCNFKELGRNRGYFNMELSENYEHINIVSGYKAIIEIYSNRLLLCAEIAHKLINRTTVLDFIRDQMSNLRGDHSRLREIAQQELVGQTVITKYNNKTYKIDEIIWDKSPRDSFERKAGSITFLDYYRQSYHINVEDQNQPLLLSNPKASERRAAEQAGRQVSPALLIPELCYLTGPILLKPFEKNFSAKNTLAKITKQDPSNTHTRLVRLIDQVNNKTEARNELNKWDLRLASDVVCFDTKVISQNYVIVFGQQKIYEKTHHPKGWNIMFRDSQLLSCVDIKDWILVYGQRDEGKANLLEKELKIISRPLGFNVSNGERIRLQDARSAYNYINAIKDRISRGKPRLVVCLIQNDNKDIYDSIKKLCCVDNGIPSQVVTCSVLSKHGQARSVITKVGIQISAKLGAEIWGMKIPQMSNMMVVGMNVYKDQEHSSKTVAAFVSSTNGNHPGKLNCTKWFSQSAFQPDGQKFADNLFQLMLRKFIF
jgi:aubergine